MLHELRVHQIELEMQNEELRAAQAALDESRERYFNLYDLAPVGYVTLSEKGLILEANLTAAGLLGVARGALVKQPLSRFIFKEDQDIYYLHRKLLFGTGEPQSCDFRMLKHGTQTAHHPGSAAGTATEKDSGAENGVTIFWAHVTASIAQSAGGEPVCRAVISDTTAKKQAELTLQESEQRYGALFENNYAVMLLVHPESGEIVDANPAASEFYGWTHAELLHLKINQINTLSPETIQKEMQLALAQQRKFFLFQHRKKDGQLCDVEVFSGSIQIAGEPLLYSIIHDITSRKQAEAIVTEQVDELRSWYNLTLGRETRILELKQEVNDLLVQLGQTQRYASATEEAAHE
jgi:PAS domain S-box-containing protein